MKKILEILPNCWRLYVCVRDSPETIGPSLAHKFAVALMYSVNCLCALYMVIIIATHQTVFMNVEEMSGKSTYFEYPSAILCPGKSHLYKYSFIHEKEWISDLGLSVSIVNILAKAAKEGKLEAADTAAALLPYIETSKNLTGMSPKQLWRNIISWTYYNASEYYNIGVAGEAFYMSNVDIDCWEGAAFKDHYLTCKRIKGIWLTNNQYCFLWNNTGRLFQFNPWGAARIHIILKLKTNLDYQVWLGNLLVNQIYFDKLARNDYTITVYKNDGVADRVCQPLIENSCEKKAGAEKLNGYWLYLISKGFRTAENFLEFRISVGTSWYVMTHVKRYDSLKVAEIVGNVFGIWVGVSVFGLVKIVIVLVKKSAKNMADIPILLIQIVVIILLAASAIYLEISNLNFLQQNRYVNQLNIHIEEGAPYPSFHLCPRFLTAFNETEVKKHKISYPLLTYITTTAILQHPMNHVFPTRTNTYFLFDKEAPAEIGYHWNFMQFPLQHVSQDLYEKYMTYAEEEYERVAKEFGVSPDEPSWNLYTQLLLDPCKGIKFCYINGKIDKSCCVYFKQVAVPYRYNFQACWLFDNHNRLLRQTQSGKQYGFSVALDVDAMRHTMTHVWLDDFLKDYYKNCSVLYNCSAKYPHDWNPGSAIILRMNDCETEELFLVIKGREGVTIMEKGVTAEISMHSTENSRLSYNDKNGCLNHIPIHPSAERKDKSYMKQEILFKRCGCYACHDPPIYHTQSVPCCSPKKVGRCITDMDMYMSHCYNKSNPQYASNNGANRLQYQYAGNLPSDAPASFMVTHENENKCDSDILFPAGSEFHGVYQNFLQNFSELSKPPCKTFRTKTQVALLPNEKAEMKDLFVYNLYYPLAQYLEFKEQDLHNFWELFGLVSGILGLFSGLTYMAVLEISISSVKKLGNNNTDDDDDGGIVSMLANYGLIKFAKRLKHVVQPEAYDAEELVESPVFTKHGTRTQSLQEHSEQVGASDYEMHAVCNEAAFVENANAAAVVETSQQEQVKTESASKNQVTSVNRSNEALIESLKHVGKPDHNVEHHASNSPVLTLDALRIQSVQADSERLSVNDDDGIYGVANEAAFLESANAEAIAAEVNEEEKVDTEPSFDNQTTDSTSWSKVFGESIYCILLTTAVYLAIVFCTRLQRSMAIDGVTVQFDMKHSGIFPPTIGLCVTRKGPRFETSKTQILSQLSKCQIQSYTIDCQNLFVKFARVHAYDCAFSSYDSYEIDAKPGTNDVDIEIEPLHEMFNVWAGDMKTIHDGIIPAEHPLKPNSHLSIFYQQWDVRESSKCGSTNVQISCPTCDQAAEIASRVEICCSVGSFVDNNISAPRTTHCVSSFYELRASVDDRKTLHTNTSLLSVSSGVNVKRVISREQRRTFRDHP